MGGRGGASGIAARATGFEYTSNGRKYTVQRTQAGVTLLNGNPVKANFDTLRNSAKSKTGYREISEKEFADRRTAKKNTEMYVNGGQARQNRMQRRKIRPKGSR